METLTLWARNGEAVRQAIELGELVHRDTASAELTDEFVLFALHSGLLSKWSEAFPDPREEPERGLAVILPAPLAGRLAGRYSRRKTGYVLRSAQGLGALGDRVAVVEPAHGLSLRGPAEDKLFSGDVVRTLLVKLEERADLSPPAPRVPTEPRVAVKVRPRASRRAVTPAVDDADAEARALQVAEQWVGWYNQPVGVSMVQYARLGRGRRLPLLAPTRVEVPLETGTYEGRGGEKRGWDVGARRHTGHVTALARQGRAVAPGGPVGHAGA